MDRLIEDKREELTRLCKTFNVRCLELFGSPVDGSFEPDTSDLDFLVEFLPLEAGGHFDAYFGLRDALEDLFGRSVDLVMTRAIRNPYFLKAVNRSRTVLYAA